MPVIDLFCPDRKIDVLTLRISELEARQARIEKAMARQRKVNEALLAVLVDVDWADIQKAIDTSLAIE